MKAMLAIAEDCSPILELQKLAYLQEAEIYNDFSIPPLTQTIAELEKEFKDKKVLKVVCNGAIIGSVRAHLENDTCYIGRLIVHPAYQNKGIGSMLMLEIESVFNTAKRFELFTGDKSIKNICFYRKLGYSVYKKETLTADVDILFLEKLMDTKSPQSSINLDLIRQQFNSQARNFDNWSVSTNVEYLQAYFDFCSLGNGDKLLDVACGTGEFIIFSAPHISKGVGIDISSEMIALARQKAEKNHLQNTAFKIGDVLRLPFNDQSFNIVVCRNAFHHMPQYPQVFSEMLRCCGQDGRVSLLDIVAYDAEEVNAYFEALEKMVDASHHAVLAKETMEDLIIATGLSLEREFELEIELDLVEYIGHATQETGTVEKIFKHVEAGLNNEAIAPFWQTSTNGSSLSFRRKVFIILGRKT